MAARNGTNNALPGSILLVIHDFAARSPDELSLAKGDRIELIERDDEFGDGWFLGKHLTNGANGLFPEVYTTPAPKGTLSALHRPRTSGDNGSQNLASSAAASAMSSPSSITSSIPLPQVQTTIPTPPQFSPIPTSPRSIIPPSASNAKGFSAVNSDSPVMSETLSVIDEHITDMRTPRSSYTNGNKRDTVGSVYSTHPSVRRSYIAGHETDEEEAQIHTEEEVLSWNPGRVAEYLEDHGVEKSHCEVFKEQDITGEVLLAMDQNSLFIKEFDLGSVGRRLKTWHKIKALQDEVKRKPDPANSTSEYSVGGAEADAPLPEVTRNRSSTTGAILPRGLATKRYPDERTYKPTTTPVPPVPVPPTQYSNVGTSLLQSMTSISRPENTYRPSAQDIRNMNRSRPTSTVDADGQDGLSKANGKKRSSSEKLWSFGQSNGKHAHTASTGSQYGRRTSSALGTSPADIDRGYFSSTEVESRNRTKKVLSKRNSNAVSAASSSLHSRNGSYVTNSRISIQSRTMGSVDDLREPMSPTMATAQQSSGSGTLSSKFSSFRSATSPPKLTGHTTPPIVPAVAKLESATEQNGTPTPTSATTESEKSSPAATSTPSIGRNLFSSARAKVTGLRSISDAVTKDEKDKTVSPTEKASTPFKDSINSPTRTGASTPSTENRSLDMSKSDAKSRTSTGSGGALMPPPPPRGAKKSRPKTKKATSAYTRGLEKKTPTEQMQNCDYSGWMKKKSGSLMTTWKPRLFILRGRRLSYYYKDDDDEEKGLIDISFHRVLPAHNETLTGLHATMTRAAGSPTAPNAIGTTPTLAEQDLKNHPPQQSEEDSGLFIFKLVPPKAGLAKGVNFTRPTVHYFAVNSRQEGRLWMAALMKATIDRDDDGVVTTTYNQKTISLNKARARRERPPALKEEGPDDRAELAGDEASEKGLGIGGIDEADSAVAGADKGLPSADTSSFLASTITTTDGSEQGAVLKEKDPVEVSPAG